MTHLPTPDPSAASSIDVRGKRLRPADVATEAWRKMFTAAVLEADYPGDAEWHRSKADEYIRAMPPWLAATVAAAAENIVQRLREGPGPGEPGTSRP